ncbi:HNH endonuclease [Streptomyces lycii]|uniref:HNH endonuclease n=1 Tax=Streptomyces lycii TaxID=2654337 RepID=A0ABQ7FN60_9ACTN|nr:HNH endonuclease signature motif containing protein [Streptomyces lycii]KAF4408667.1 HNH endonuclease [Streptomyces lycii]
MSACLAFLFSAGGAMPYSRASVIAAGTGAAARMRKAARRAGYVRCESCGLRYLASAVDVDHIVPLCAGGADVDGNVQYLCRAVCHRAKTRRDLGCTSPPF